MNAQTPPLRSGRGLVPAVLALVILCLVLSPRGADAQAPASDRAPAEGGVPAPPWKRTSVVIGIGGGDGPGAELGVVVPAGPGAVVLRIAGTTKVCDLGFNSPCDGEDSNTDYAALYGLAKGSGRSWGRAALGVGVVRISRFEGGPYTCSQTQWSRTCGADTFETKRTAVGMAFRLDAVAALGGSFGIGLATFGNLNGEHSFAVVAVSFNAW